MQEKLEQINKREIFRDKLNSFLVDVGPERTEFRLYGSSLKTKTFGVELTSEELATFKLDLEELLNKTKAEVIISGLAHLTEDHYYLSITRTIRKGKLSLTVRDNESKKVLLRMKVETSKLLSLLD